jgi:tryptophanyl-tRNA synthetase
MHKTFTQKEDVKKIDIECRRAGIGCVECKKCLAENINKNLEPFREKRAELAAQPDHVRTVLNEGAARARKIAEKTMAEVREAVQLP